MFDEFSQGMFLLFVFQVWDRCFQLIGSLVDLLHFIFEIADMSIPKVFGHSLALPSLPPATTYTENSPEFLRREPSLQGGNGAGVRVYLETNTLFLVRLAEHVDVLADVGEHSFLAVGNDELHLSHVIEKETEETGVKCLDVLGVQGGHRNGLGELFFQKGVLVNMDGVDL